MARIDLRLVVRRYAQRLEAGLEARLGEVRGILDELDDGLDLAEAAELLRLAHRKIDPCPTTPPPKQAEHTLRRPA
jgi:hypothetical protein